MASFTKLFTIAGLVLPIAFGGTTFAQSHRGADSVLIQGKAQRVVRFSGQSATAANPVKPNSPASLSRPRSGRASQLAFGSKEQPDPRTAQVADLQTPSQMQLVSQDETNAQATPEGSLNPANVEGLRPPRSRSRESVVPLLSPPGSLGRATGPTASPSLTENPNNSGTNRNGEPPKPVSPSELRRIDEERRALVNSVEELLSSVQRNDYLKLETTLHPDWISDIRFPLLRYQSHYELSLVEAIHTAIEFAPEIEILRSQVGIDQAEVVRQQSGFDWAQFIEANWDEVNIPNGSNLEGVDRLETHTLASSAGLSKLNQFGGTLQLAQELGYADSNSQIFFPQNQASNGLVLEYQQPLLQGAGLLVNQSQINIAVANAASSREDFVAGLQQHIFSVINAYWAMVARRGEYVVQKRSYERALTVAKIVTNRKHLDVGPIQSARAEATLGARRAAVLQAEYAVVFAQEQLLRLMFGSKFESRTERELLPTSDMLGPLRTVDMDMEVQLGLQNRPEVLRALQQIKARSIEQGVAQNQLLPVLDLTLSMSNRGLQGNRGFLSAFTDQWDFGDPSYGIGLSYALPVGNRAAKANVKQTQLRLKQIQKEFEQTVSDVSLEVRNASHSLVLSGKQRKVSGNALGLARKELEILEQRIVLLMEGNQTGPLYLENLLQTQERLAAAELGLMQASSDYALAVFELQRANGSLLKCSPLPSEAAPASSWSHRAAAAPATMQPSAPTPSSARLQADQNMNRLEMLPSVATFQSSRQNLVASQPSPATYTRTPSVPGAAPAGPANYSAIDSNNNGINPATGAPQLYGRPHVMAVPQNAGPGQPQYLTLHGAPNQPVTPQQAVPHQTVSQHSVPQHSVPQQAVPQPSLPQYSVPQQSVPQYTLPSEYFAAPQYAVMHQGPAAAPPAPNTAVQSAASSFKQATPARQPQALATEEWTVADGEWPSDALQ
ncbi:MAG: TolC family protein, partial [Planctomycetota bacterium]